MLQRRQCERVDGCDLVFHQGGEAIERRTFHKAWMAAREAAELPNLIPHDLRGSAVRQLERARVPRQVAMRLVGHCTESIYRRYAIDSEGRRAGGRRETGCAPDCQGERDKIVTVRSIAEAQISQYSQECLNNWCRGRESNPHDRFRSRDFKSRASASFATPA